MVQDRAIFTVTDWQEVVYDVSNGAIFNDPPTSDFKGTFTISETVQDRHVVITDHTKWCVAVMAYWIVPPLIVADLQGHFGYFCLKISVAYFSRFW